MAKEHIEPKMRITMRNPQGLLISDRLVDQRLELNTGARETHSGGILTLEFSVVTREDAEMVKAYLQQLMGELPTAEKKKYSTSTVKEKVMGLDQYKTFITEATKKTQDLVMEHLRTFGFKFYTLDHLQDLGIELNLRDKHDAYQFMVKELKAAKNPLNDKLDTNLVFAIKLIGEHRDRIHIYMKDPIDGPKPLEYVRTLNIPWPEGHNINFKKLKIGWKFPKWMTHGERKKWRVENDKLMKNPELKPSKFHARWAPDITKL